MGHIDIVAANEPLQKRSRALDRWGHAIKSPPNALLELGILTAIPVVDFASICSGPQILVV